MVLTPPLRPRHTSEYNAHELVYYSSAGGQLKLLALGYVLGCYFMAGMISLLIGHSTVLLLGAPLILPGLILLGFIFIGTYGIGTTLALMLLALIAWVLAIIGMIGLLTARYRRRWNVWPWVVLVVHVAVMVFIDIWVLP